jgi:pimeloyl-ACP methyl ester carboxylesterase
MIDDVSPGLRDLRVDDASGELREYLLFVPDGTVRGVAVIFHPFGSRPELVMHGGTDGDYLIRPLTGVIPSAQALGLAILAPRARGRRVDGVSLAWKGHLDAVWAVSESLRDRFGLAHIGAGGLSMGGLEALVFAGLHPEGITAAWAVNPIVDLAHWSRDLAGTEFSDEESGLTDLIATEVGGSPDDMVAEYAARSPFDHVEALTHVRVRLTWSPVDTVIPNQRTAHAHLLASALRRHGGEVVEDIVTHVPVEGSVDAGRFAHEACDVREAMGWLAEQLNHSDKGETT